MTKTAKQTSVALREVEVRTWPERADVLVIDQKEALVLAHYPLLDPAPGKIADPYSAYDIRARRALSELESDQEYLQGHFDIAPDHAVKLSINNDARERIDALLDDYGFSLSALEFPVLNEAAQQLLTQDPQQLFAFLCDWYDVVERHYPAGAVERNPQAWVHRARPDAAYHFHYLAAGLDSRDGAAPEDSADAYDVFRELVDVDLAALTFGHVLRWAYFHRTEFAGHEPFPLQALTAAAAAAG